MALGVWVSGSIMQILPALCMADVDGNVVTYTTGKDLRDTFNCIDLHGRLHSINKVFLGRYS